MSILDNPMVMRVRRNHALEHATIHILSQHHAILQVAGRSWLNGFYVYGQVNTEELAAAASEALARLQSGEIELAVHPRCGTNVVTAGVMAGLSAFTVMSGRSRSKWDKLPTVIMAATAAIILAQPLGAMLQSKVTTSPDVQNLRILGVKRQEHGSVIVHQVETAQE
jgi:hypothetical protein